MSFERPNIAPELDQLRTDTDLRDVAKALGYGVVATDSGLLTQGGAASYESLEDTITEITLRDQDMKVLNSITQTQAGQLIDEWNEVYSLGYKRGASVSNEIGMTKEGTRQGRRRYIRLKFLTQRWGVNQTLLKQKNFMQEMNKEDVAALTRLRTDKTWMIYAGNAKIGDDGTGGPSAGHEFDGIDQIIEDAAYYGYFDGPMVYDAFIQGSGLDANGLSNPKDLETGLLALSQRMIQPTNGTAQSPKMWMGTSVRNLVNRFTNFEPVQVLNGTAQQLTVGAVVQAFTNNNTEQQYTSLHTDPFLPDSQNRFFLTPDVRGEAVACVAPTVAVAPGTDAASYFQTGWDGNYFYFVAPFGIGISDKGYEGAAVASAVAAVAVGGKVTLTITPGSGGEESGYLIYRSRRNGTNNPADARLMARIPRNFGGATTFVDLNRELPGASSAYIIDWSNPETIEMRYLYAPFRIELPRSASAAHLIPGAVSASYALRSRRHRAIGRIKNVMADPSWNARG